MTNTTGRSFLSYRRIRKDEAALLIHAQHDHGIPTWQDITNLATTPTEDEIRRVLADPTIANAVLLITPEVEDSTMMRSVEIPKILNRVEQGDNFFAVPLAAGGLDYGAAAAVVENNLSAQNLADWNMYRLADATISERDAADIAARVLAQRVQAIHRQLPPGEPLRLGLFTRKSPPFELGNALVLDWSARFAAKEARSEIWRDLLLPALARVADVIHVHAPGREVHAFGLTALPAAAALGCAFISTSGIKAAWRQYTPGQPEQLWTIHTARETSGVSSKLWSKDQKAYDVAVLVSVADNTEPLFAQCRESLPSFRALLHVTKPGSVPFAVNSPGQALDIALTVQEGLRQLRQEYGKVGTVHIFLAVPAGLAMLIGQLLNTFGAVQTYEHVAIDGSGCYRPAALLRPCT